MVGATDRTREIDGGEGGGHRGRLAERSSLSFAAEESAGLVLAAKVRLAIIAPVLAWLALYLPMAGAAYAFELGSIGVFGLLGAAHLLCAQRRLALPISIYALFALDVAFMGVMFSTANPFVAMPDFNPAVILQLPNFVWFFIFLMQAAFALTPRYVIWCGACILAVRALQSLFVWSHGTLVTEADLPAGDWQAWLDLQLDPRFFSLDARFTELIFTLSMTFGLAAIVRRSRALVLKRAATERDRASLARYFSPNVVDAVTRNRAALDRVHSTEVAVMFVDIKGFTKLCEQISPEEIAALLRDYYRRLTESVFAHHGTLDKFLGDGVMATFGTPNPRPEAAADALACGFAILAETARWNRARLAQSRAPIDVSVGLHYGSALVGNIGDERRLEYAVVGDTVNVSSRVEGLTRELGTSFAITDDCVAAVRKLSGSERLLADLIPRGEIAVRGRAAPVGIWCSAGR